METTDTINPIEAITAEIEKAMRAPDKLGLLSVRSANAWIEESKNTPMPKKYCHGLIVEGENTVLFARSNVGKSLFASQLAEEIAREEKVLFIDCELSSKQFEMRYTDEKTISSPSAGIYQSTSRRTWQRNETSSAGRSARHGKNQD